MGKASRYSPEVRERAVRMVLEHERDYESQWAAMKSIGAKIGCTAETRIPTYCEIQGVVDC